jgi:hypothetical protein
MRVDIFSYRPVERIAEIRLFINGVWAELEATEATHGDVTIANGIWRCTTATPNYGDRVVVRAGAQSVSFRRVAE